MYRNDIENLSNIYRYGVGLGWVACVYGVCLGRVWDASAHMIRHRSHTTSPSIRLAIENNKIPRRMLDKMQIVIQAHTKAVQQATDVVFAELKKPSVMEVVDGNKIASAKQSIVAAVKSCKEWVQLFEMYVNFESDGESNTLSSDKIIDELNASGKSLELLFQACERGQVLTRLATDA